MHVYGCNSNAQIVLRAGISFNSIITPGVVACISVIYDRKYGAKDILLFDFWEMLCFVEATIRSSEPKSRTTFYNSTIFTRELIFCASLEAADLNIDFIHVKSRNVSLGSPTLNYLALLVGCDIFRAGRVLSSLSAKVNIDYMN